MPQNVVGPNYDPRPATYGGSIYGLPWPKDAESRREAYARRWADYRQEPYTEEDIRRLALFVAANTAEQRTAVTQRVLPDYRFVCDVNAAAIATDGVALDVIPDAPAGALDAGWQVWQASGVDHRLMQWARNLCVEGAGYIEVVRRPSDGQPVLVWHCAPAVDVTYDATGTILTRAVVTLELPPEMSIGADGAYEGDAKPVAYRRLLTPTNVTVWRDGVVQPDESGPHTLGRVPLVRVGYGDIAEGSMPVNAAQGLGDALAFANSTLMQIATIGSRNANPILVFLGALIGDGAAIQKQGKALSLPKDSDARWLELGLSGLKALSENTMDTLDRVRQTYPEWMFVDASANASGTALGYRASAFVDKVRPARESMYAGLGEAIGIAVVMASNTAWSEAADVYVVDGGSALSLDVGAALKLRTDLAEAGYMRRRDVVAFAQASRVVPDQIDADAYAAAAAAEREAATQQLAEELRLLRELRDVATLEDVARIVDSAEPAEPPDAEDMAEPTDAEDEGDGEDVDASTNAG